MFGLYLLLGLTLCTAASLIHRGWRNGITPVPSSPAAARCMVAAAQTELRRIHRSAGTAPPRIIETGSGWGGPALSLAAQLPRAEILGYENSPVPYLVSLLRAKLSGRKNLCFRYGDFRRAPVCTADMLVCYLSPAGMREISRTLHTRCPQDVPVVISNTFSLPEKTPSRRIHPGGAPLMPVYVFR